jgi:crotonobetainyl-CoA:carnitine CoA-transferase CaiB-like acyl-CoA transferase
VFEDLVRTADAVYSNLRGDVPGKLRMRYQDLKDINPAIVCCSLSGFGMTGPRSDEAGYDYILQGMAGWMSLAGEPDSPPTKTGPSLVDYSGGFVAALAMLAGLHAARRDGVGMDCDVSLFDTAVGLLAYPATWYLTAGLEPTRTSRSAHPSLVPFGNFPTADDWIVIGCAKEKFWQRLLVAIDRPELAADPRFVDFAARYAHADECIAAIDEVLRAEPASHWLATLTAEGVPCGPVNTVAQALADPHTAARSMVIETEHPVFGTVRQPASPVRVGVETPAYQRAPFRGEHHDELLRDLLGYGTEHIAGLTAAGAFG